MTELHNNNVYYSSINWLDRDNSNSNNPQVNKASFHQLPPIQQMNSSPGMDNIAHHANKMYPNTNWKENNNFDEDHSQYGQPTPSPSASTERSSSSRSRKRGVPSTKEIHVEKNTEGKPPYSYATLIKYAIENSEKKKLTLSEIYQWVIDHYPYYSSAGTGWKNSIRHNLSLNKSFVRVPRPINEPGKGSYWQVDYRAVAESDSRTKITMRNRGSRSGSDPAKVPPYHLPDDHYHQRFNRDTRSLSLDSNMSTKLAISAGSNSSSSSSATNMPFYPAPFSAFAVGYDNRHFGHHHHHHHHHRHSVDFTRSPYLTNYEMYTTPQPVDSPYSPHPHHIHRIQSASSLPKSNATAPPTPSSSGPFYDSNNSNTQYIYSNTVVQQRHQQHPSSPIKKEPTDGCSTPQPTCNKPSSTMKNDGYEPWM